MRQEDCSTQLDPQQKMLSQPGASTLEAAARRLPASAAPTPAYATQYAAVHTDVAVRTTSEMTAHSSIQQWLQSSERMAASPPPVESVTSSGYAGHQPTLPVGAEAATLAPCAPSLSHVSHSTRRTRRSGTSSVAAEVLGFTREMSCHMFSMMTEIQAQAKNQRLSAEKREEDIRNDNLAQAEKQRVDAKQ